MADINPIEHCSRELTAQGRSVAKLYAGNPNENGIQFPSEILSAIYLNYFQAQQYAPDPQGWLRARAAIAEYYNRERDLVRADDIVLTSGTSESFWYLCALLTQPGDNILLPTPGYPLFGEVARLAHIEPKNYRLDSARGWRLDPDSVERAINDRTRAILLISPHNPTGMVATTEEIHALAALAVRHNIALICDEVFCEFYFGTGNFPRLMELAPDARCFTLNGISKMFALPALKLGWIAATGPETARLAAVDRLAHIADTFLSCHEPIQRGLPQLFTGGAPFVSWYRTEMFKRRALALTALALSPRIHVVPPDGGFYLMARIDSPRWPDEEALVIALLQEHGVFVHPGYFFDFDDGVHLVISFLTEPTRLARGLEAILAMV